MSHGIICVQIQQAVQKTREREREPLPVPAPAPSHAVIPGPPTPGTLYPTPSWGKKDACQRSTHGGKILTLGRAVRRAMLDD